VRRTTVKGIVCVLLILPGLGCPRVYRFRCTSRPAGAVVLVGQEMMGETACSFKIPRKSKLVQGDQIEFTFCLPDGREQKRVVELRRVKATNPVAEVFAAPFLLASVGLFALFHGDPRNTELPFPSESQSKDDHGGLTGTLLGLGFLGIGAGVYALLGGDAESLSDYPIWVDFNEPPDAGGQRTPPVLREEDRGREETQSQRRL
jgi:hypothetical protein